MIVKDVPPCPICGNPPEAVIMKGFSVIECASCNYSSGILIHTQKCIDIQQAKRKWRSFVHHCKNFLIVDDVHVRLDNEEDLVEIHLKNTQDPFEKEGTPLKLEFETPKDMAVDYVMENLGINPKIIQ